VERLIKALLEILSVRRLVETILRRNYKSFITLQPRARATDVISIGDFQDVGILYIAPRMTRI